MTHPVRTRLFRPVTLRLCTGATSQVTTLRPAPHLAQRLPGSGAHALRLLARTDDAPAHDAQDKEHPLVHGSVLDCVLFQGV